MKTRNSHHFWSCNVTTSTRETTTRAWIYYVRMAQFVLKIGKLSHIMGPRASQDLRSPSPIMAPAITYMSNIRDVPIVLLSYFSRYWARCTLTEVHRYGQSRENQFFLGRWVAKFCKVWGSSRAPSMRRSSANNLVLQVFLVNKIFLLEISVVIEIFPIQTGKVRIFSLKHEGMYFI